MTVLEAIQRGTTFLEGKGVDAPRLQVELLLAHTLAVPRLSLYLQFDRVLTERETDQARVDLRRRGQRVPLQHILGVTSFCGLEFRVGPAALVPRPETELLAEKAWTRLADPQWAEASVLDFGTGTGCLGITLVVRCPGVRCLAIDISEEALALASENAERLGAAARVTFLKSDSFAAVPIDARFDLIVSNPPYIPTGEIERLQPEVRDHDPRLALDGGGDGLEFYRRLAAGAAAWMRPGGLLLVELGDGQAGAVSSLFQDHNWVVEGVYADYSAVPRVLQARRPTTQS